VEEVEGARALAPWTERGGIALNARRFVIRFVLVALLVVLAFVMYSVGKEHSVLLDNKTAVIDGVEYVALKHAILVVDDGGKKNDIRADGRLAQKMVGKSHRLKLEILRDDKSVEKTVERTVKLDMDMKKWMISLPALAQGAVNIYAPAPVIVITPPPEPEEKSGDVELPGGADEGFGMEEALPGI
jgi:hypothetical protein